MARTPKQRLVAAPPLFKRFKPSGIAGEKLLNVSMELDEYEAIRLADYLGLEHEEASQSMGVSRSTFTRLIERARHKLSQLLIEGVRLEIAGGMVHFKDNLYQCEACHHFFRHTFQEPSVHGCPQCGKMELISYAESFGHGHCCQGGLQ